MKKIVLAACAVLAISGCKKGVPPILQPVVDAGCAVETNGAQAMGVVIVAQCAGTDAIACGKAIQTGLGNANLCNMSVPAPAPAAPALAGKHFGKIGDVSQGDINAAKGKNLAKPAGIIGGIACQAGEQIVLGLLTGAIPQACGCTKSLDAGALGGLLVSACTAAIPL